MSQKDIFPPDVVERERTKSLAELRKLALMVDNWKQSYLLLVDEYWVPDDTIDEWEFVCNELISEVESVMYPYIQRMRDCEYITQKEVQAFAAEAHGVLVTLKEEVAALSVQKQEEYDAKLAEERDNDPKKLKDELDDMRSKYEQLMRRLEDLER